ncbi:MAG TPA: urate oxidase [Candidatus Acidoferrum sp.]|nr:urate oxidase [Candidatus Acidoferrum sp.]
MAKLRENRYGKSRVRLVRVKRHAVGNDFDEWTVEVLLCGDFASCFTVGDNSKILPTDTMKNTVYSVARDSKAGCIEDFAKELTEFLLRRNPQVSEGDVSVSAKAWEHLNIHGKAHPTTFVQSSGERQTTSVVRKQNGELRVVSGLENLVIMKTADSAFTGYIKDSLTTLTESSDRLFGTAVRARWTYTKSDADFAGLRHKIRESLLTVFATHKSESVQHTLYAMAENVLQNVAQVADVELRMPNLHCLLVDLSRFGQDNRNEIFVPIDEPHGYIEARISREG